MVEMTGGVLDYIAPSKSPFIEHEVTTKGEIFRTPYQQNISNKFITAYGEDRFVFIRRTFSFLSELAQYFLPVGSKRTLYKVANEYLKHNKVDVIIATGDPFVLFHYANKLSKKHAIPWIADYRDPWSHYFERKKNIRFAILKWNEKRIVKNSSYILTVSEFLASKLGQLMENVPTKVIANGYDPELIHKEAHIEQENDVLTLAYAGTIYEWHPLERFLEGINDFKLSCPDFNFRIIFYGLNQVARLQTALIQFPEIVKHIQFEPRLTNEALIAKMHSHHIMLLFNYYAYMGTKIFDYLGVKRTMLLCFENDPVANELKEKLYRIDDVNANQNLQADTIRKHKAGVVAYDKQDLVQLMQQFAIEFEANRSIQCHSKEVHIYSRKEQLKQLAELIKTNF
jgi:glycosyltransferase involved in cell wall biosynthesis